MGWAYFPFRLDLLQYILVNSVSSFLQSERDGIQPTRSVDFPMTLLVPVLILAILVLAWIAWLAFGPTSNPIMPSYFLRTDSLESTEGDSLVVGSDAGASKPAVEETEHVRTRLHALNGSAASLTGNALHMELRPSLQRYSKSDARVSEPF
jgi:hypothetical protein